MLERVLNLFRKDQQAAQQRDQAQGEALIDLLVWTMFVDRHVASVEAQQIRKEAEDLHWDGHHSLDRFIDNSVKRVRDILGSETAEEAYLDDIYLRLANAGMRLRALTACEELIGVDGDRAEAEFAHLERIKMRFTQEEPSEL
ncbi:MAG: hypothetical protein CSA62_01370 [Planctomycetota bacterium]|nr:MAG: hypothetical protein CSA62_01370 [Planctomycetota bacterium]